MAVKPVQWLSGVALVTTTAAVLGAGALGARYGRSGNECPLETGRSFPEMTFSSPAGTSITTGALRGKNAVLMFTTPTCPACRLEAPAWRELAAAEAGAVTLWQITVGTAAVSAPTIQPAGHVQTLIDDLSSFAGTLHASRVPLVVLVDSEQVVRGCFTGVQPAAKRHLALQRLLGHEPPTAPRRTP